jgi:hypothetical protein
MTGLLQNLQQAASLCTLCRYYVEDSRVSGAEGGVDGVMGTIVTSIAICERWCEGVRGGDGEGRRLMLAGDLS